MCYEVTTHTLRCDCRPIISDGTNHFVNPYDEPEQCECPRRGRTPMDRRCDLHGCCERKSAIFKCDNFAKCFRLPKRPRLGRFTIYQQSPRVEPTDPMWPDSPRLVTNHNEPPWHPFPEIDAHHFGRPHRGVPEGLVPRESEEFRDALRKAIESGRRVKRSEEKEIQLPFSLVQANRQPNTLRSLAIQDFQARRRELVRIVQRGNRHVSGISSPVVN